MSKSNIKHPIRPFAVLSMFIITAALSFNALALPSDFAGANRLDFAPPSCNIISAPTGLTALRNTSLSVPISTNSVTGLGVLSFDYTFTYNPSTLAYVSVDQSSTLSSGMEITVNSSTAGTLIISGFGSTDLTGSGTLIKVNFNVTGAIGTTSALSFTSFTYNEGTPCATTTNGSMSVVSGTISGTITYLNSVAFRPVAGVVVTAAGTPVVVTNSDAGGLYSLSGLGNSAYTVTPTKTGDILGAISGFDASRIAQHVVNLNPFPFGGGAYQSADVTGNGTITSFDASQVARYVVSLSSSNTGTWRFVSPSTSYTIPQVETGVSSQNYSAILMGDVTGNWNGAENPTRPSIDSEKIRPEDLIGVSAPKMSAGSGSEIVVPLALRNLNRKDVIAYQFELGYQRKVIQPTANPCDVLGTVSKDLSVTCNAETPGVLRIVVFGVRPLADDGILLNLRFTVVGSAGGVSPLTFKGLLLNEGGPLSRSTDGEIRVTDPTSDTDSIRGQLLSANGQGIGKAKVQLTSGSGETRVVYADGSGFFNFDKVAIGETYVISVISTRYTFAPLTVSAAKGTTRINLIAGQ